MGFALDTYGKPVYNQTPQTVLDLQAAADFARIFANVRTGTKAQREALTAGQLVDGLKFRETDTGDEYARQAGGWVRTFRKDTGWLPLGMTLSSGWSVQSGDALEYRIKNDVLYLNGRLNATAGAGNSPFTAPLPADLRPLRDATVYVGTTGGAAVFFVTVLPNSGQFTVFKGGQAVNNLPLQAVPGVPLS